MKQPIEVRGIEMEFVIIRINGNDIAKLSHDQADELAGKLLAVTCRILTPEREATCQDQ